MALYIELVREFNNRPLLALYRVCMQRGGTKLMSMILLQNTKIWFSWSHLVAGRFEMQIKLRRRKNTYPLKENIYNLFTLNASTYSHWNLKDWYLFTNILLTPHEVVRINYFIMQLLTLFFSQLWYQLSKNIFKKLINLGILVNKITLWILTNFHCYHV